MSAAVSRRAAYAASWYASAIGFHACPEAEDLDVGEAIARGTAKLEALGFTAAEREAGLRVVCEAFYAGAGLDVRGHG